MGECGWWGNGRERHRDARFHCASTPSSAPAGVVHAVDDVSDIPNTPSLEERSVGWFPRFPDAPPGSNLESLLDNDGFWGLVSTGARHQ